MRRVIDPQMSLGEIGIADIPIDPKSRDDIPQILLGLQSIYTTPELRERVFAILEEVVPVREGEGESGKVATDTGRPGMEQWKILVLGVLRLGLNADYDRIQELANQHATIRQMLGHSEWGDETRYHHQTLKDNLRLFTPEILDRINQEVVNAGHRLLKKSPDDGLNTRADSFVVETDVHFPTDISLLFDAIRKTIETCADFAEANGLTEWRQSAYQIRKFKKHYRAVQGAKHSSSKDEAKRQQKQEAIREAHEAYLAQAEALLERARETRLTLELAYHVPSVWLRELDDYMSYAEREIDQIRRRVLEGETIPHDEKVFSIFEPHTEWISKGKAGVPVELGLRVCIVEDEHRFILHHQVMEKTTDDKIAVPLVKDTQQRFPQVATMSFDKGFHSPENQRALSALLDRAVLPKKGRLSKADQAREFDPEFIALRRRHSAVESAINALEAHGLDKCPDHSIKGFKRYVALAVVARNIHRLGAIVRDAQKQRPSEKRKRAA